MMFSCKSIYHSLSSRSSSTFRPRKYVVPKAIDIALGDYITAYSHFICKPESIQVCLDAMIVPPEYEQLRIIQNLQAISLKVDLEGLEGIVMKLLITRDQETLDTLLRSLVSFQEKREVINSIIRFTYEITMDGNSRGIDI